MLEREKLLVALVKKRAKEQDALEDKR